MTTAKVRAGLLMLAGLVVGVLATVAVLNLWPQSYDEAAHRAAVEAELGHPVKDWATVRDNAVEACALSADALDYRVATSLDVGGEELAAVARLGLVYRCPDRVAEWDETADFLRAAR